MMNVVVIAYSCSPGEGSEPGIGWNYVSELSRKHINLTVITRKNNREKIQKEGLKRVNFIYHDLGSVPLRLKKSIPFGLHIYIRLWQKSVYKNIVNNLNVDLVHHLNLVAFWNIPPYRLLECSKFIWGPVGISDTIPWTHLKHFKTSAILYELVLKFMININSLRLSRIKGLSHGLLIRNKSSEVFFEDGISSLRDVLCETGIRSSEIGIPKILDPMSLQIICVGRMVYWKGFMQAVKAFEAYINRGGHGNLLLIGDGPEFSVIRSYIAKNNLVNHVVQLRSVSREVVLTHLKNAHIMLHPSFRDGAPFAVLEAMSNGVVPIILNTLGPSDLVSPNTGIILDRSRHLNEIVEQITKSLFEIVKSPTVYAQKSKDAIHRAREEYTWESHGDYLYEFYKKSIQ